jgi:hypothetical protein
LGYQYQFEPEFGNPSFETPKKQNGFNFQLTWFSAIVDFILWFCTSLSSETCNFELFISDAKQQ